MALAVAAALQVFDDVLDAPRFEPAAHCAIEPRCEPVADHPAAESAATLVGTEDILGRVAGAAMAERLDQVAASVPVGPLLLIGLQDSGPEEEEIPQPHHNPEVEREAQGRRRRLVLHRWNGREISADRQNVVACEL